MWTDFFEPYLRKRAEQGKGLDYCFHFDNYRVFGHREQEESYYGTIGLGTTTAPFVYISDNLNEINKNRAKVGLLPLSRRSPR
jgi:hypothetical protein